MVLPRIIANEAVQGPTVYTDANSLGIAGFHSEQLTKVIQSPYTSVHGQNYLPLFYYCNIFLKLYILSLILDIQNGLLQ